MFDRLKDPNFKELEKKELNLGGRNRRIDGGLNTADLPYSLDSSQSPDMLNMWFYEGALRKRWGQNISFSLNSGAGVDDVCVTPDRKVFLLSAGKLWLYTPYTQTSAPVYTLSAPLDGAAPKGSFIRYGRDVFFINGREYIRWNGSAFVPITPYIPLLFENCDAASGSGKAVSEPNLLTDEFRISFRVAAASSLLLFPADIPALSDAAVTAYVNGSEMHENSGFTVDRIRGYASFSSQIPQNSTVVFHMKYSRDESMDPTGCRFGIVYGGDSRMILGGDGTNRVFCSESFDPSYFPVSRCISAGSGDPVTGFGLQYNLVAVFKKSEISALTPVRSGSGTVLIPSVLNPFTGCDIPGSIANIGNRIVFANTWSGVHVITSTSLDTERNVVQVSRNINNMLLSEEGLENAASIVYEGRYWLCVNGHVYLWDNDTRPLSNANGADAQRSLAWYYFEGINAGSFFSLGQELLYGEADSPAANGNAVVFSNNFSDFGREIPARWRSAVLDFGQSNRYKGIDRVWIITRANYPSYAKIKYLYDVRSGDTSVEDKTPINQFSFNWKYWRWNVISWSVPGVFRTHARNPRRRRVIFFSVLMENDVMDRDLSIVDISIQYHSEYRIK